MRHLLIFPLLVGVAVSQQVVSDTHMRWCVISFDEEQKCEDLAKRAKTADFEAAYDAQQFGDVRTIVCVRGRYPEFGDYFDCMKLIAEGKADVVNLEAGLAQYGSDWHQLRPIVMERYDDMDDPEISTPGRYFYSVAVVKKSSAATIKSVNDLKGKKSCHAGTGFAGSWNVPLAKLVKDRVITDISDCTVKLKMATDFFGDMCAPGALGEAYNPFGLNPPTACAICNATDERRCLPSDPYANYFGALRCLTEGAGEVSWQRSGIFDSIAVSKIQCNMSLPQYAKLNINVGELELLCPDGRRAPVEDYFTCNFGQVAPNVIVTSKLYAEYHVSRLVRMFTTFWTLYGQHIQFNTIFRSCSYGYNEQLNLLFNDNTVKLNDLTSLTNFDYFDQVFPTNYQDEVVPYLNYCPALPVRWCTTNSAELDKCGEMSRAFKFYSLKPELECVIADSIIQCMEFIRDGDADLINLDPGEMYVAGTTYGLKPIIASDYGDGDHSYYVVAVAQKADPITTLFNLRERRTCHPAINTAAGWFIPMLILVGSKVMPVEDCDLASTLGRFLTYGCMPGVLDKQNRRGHMSKEEPIQLCEGCAAGSYRRCVQNPWELYWGHSGAFRCVVENSGDIAFVKHFTVRENTDGFSQAEWARNRRSEDYQLVCRDGTRASVDDWRSCNLGYVPASSIATSSFKTESQVHTFWQLLNHAQLYFSSDLGSGFKMFDSPKEYKDLMFEDATFRLMLIPEENRTLERWLTPEFMKVIHQVERFNCVSGSSSAFFNAAVISMFWLF